MIISRLPHTRYMDGFYIYVVFPVLVPTIPSLPPPSVFLSLVPEKAARPENVGEEREGTGVLAALKTPLFSFFFEAFLPLSLASLS
jgi:hypothetical protein